MVFGEFEWQTEKLIKRQIDVNLLGTFKLTNAFAFLLRQHKGGFLWKLCYAFDQIAIKLFTLACLVKNEKYCYFFLLQQDFLPFQAIARWLIYQV